MEFKENNQAIYLQIADYCFENILQKKWISGDKISSIRDLAVEFEVNPNTTMRTINFLQDKGIIFNKRGIGYFVTEDAYKKIRDLKKEQFIKEDLPLFFKTMHLLDLSLDDIGKFYQAMNTSHT
ncbi:MAG: GntR family transcriptional regulator [Bacteroidetes bacterium]|nr:GntR family transcriptional regulator [Bacteroidota bacterium]HET6244803.1 GntR family transcriptional regulator [Bacteroidia bacterium]